MPHEHRGAGNAQGTEKSIFDLGERQTGDSGFGTAQLRSRHKQKQKQNNRKAKKLERQQRLDGLGKRNKDYGVPDLKQEKRDIERTRAFQKEKKLRKIQKRQKAQRAMRQGLVADKRAMPKAPNLAAMSCAAQARNKAFSAKVSKLEELMKRNEGNPFTPAAGDSSRKASTKSGPQSVCSWRSWKMARL